MKKILVPTDFSPAAANALAVATQIAQLAGVQVLLVHLLDPNADAFFESDQDSEISPEESQKLHLAQAELQLQELANQSPHGLVTTQALLGKIPQAINEVIENEVVGLVVMATHTATAIEDMIFGSHTEKVIRTATCPVLTLREPVKDFTVKNIVLASNFAEDQLRGMAKIQALQQAFGATLHLAYINTPEDFMNNRRIAERKEAFLQKFPLQNFTFTIYNDFTIETGIAHFAEDCEADLIVLSAHHWEDYEGFDTSHTSDVIISQVSCPVMTF
ncbi:MAG: universal stress protein [Microscillaceae bacterium]|jgi:nucleotide-binding universal stress UspA family protein|nr:universal stress protein [Microscillaceae bacterium]